MPSLSFVLMVELYWKCSHIWQRIISWYRAYEYSKPSIEIRSCNLPKTISAFTITLLVWTRYDTISEAWNLLFFENLIYEHIKEIVEIKKLTHVTLIS